MSKTTVLDTEVDATQVIIKAALMAARAAQKVAYDDMRTSGTICTNRLDFAVTELEQADNWMRDLHAEEIKDGQPDPPKLSKRPKEPTACSICEEDFEDEEDVLVCTGCGRVVCSDCVDEEGEEELCSECR